jgi:hypothetical protein
MRSVDAGYFSSFAVARVGRGAKSPPQFGHLPCSFSSTQSAQKVHSKEQIKASCAPGGKSLLQHSQLGRICSISRFLY